MIVCVCRLDHVRDELSPLLDQFTAHGSPLLVQRFIQPLSDHQKLLLGLLLQRLYMLGRNETPPGGWNEQGTRKPSGSVRQAKSITKHQEK